MNTVSTVATLRALYESLASSAANFIPELNEVTYRLMNTDLWHGCTDEVLFPASTETMLVLPRQFVSVIGYDINNVPRPTWGTFHQYVEKGIGWVDPDNMSTFGLISDNDVPSQVPITGTVTLRVKPSLAVDAGKVIRFYGTDQNDRPIYTQPTGVEGIALTTAVPSSDTTQQFKSLTMVQCQTTMAGTWTLWQVDTTTGAETQIGLYYPGDNIPSFRRYKIGLRQATDTVRCFCRRQWVRLVNETDPVFPGCQSAIKIGFKALQLEDANKYGSDTDPTADDMWERAFNELDRELSVRRGSELPSLKIIGGPYPMWQSIVN